MLGDYQTTTVPKDTSAPSPQRSAVKKWNDRVDEAKLKFEPDFERMRENMAFVANMQWPGQDKVRGSRYVSNLTLRAINQKVAMLYAKNPKVRAIRRKRLDFSIWDGKVETLMQAGQMGQVSLAQAGVLPPEINALFSDYEHGRAVRKEIDSIGQTLELGYQYQMDTQEPEFKTQAKQWVRRACVCGVGYLKVSLERNYENGITQSATRSTPLERIRRAKAIMDEIAEDEVQENDARMEELRALLASTEQPDISESAPRERLIFDFPPSSSVIPDPRCRSLKGFIGAHWLCEEYKFPLSFVNAFYEVDIECSSDLKTYDGQGKPLVVDTSSTSPGTECDPVVCLREIYDLDTKSRFVICEGHPDYIEAPELVSPATSSFWPFFALTFNDVESEPGCKASIFPPSDVDLLWHAQREWNRTRDELRKHRRANVPKYLTTPQVLDDEGVAAITQAENSEVVTLKLPPGVEPGKAVQPLQQIPIDPSLYDTRGLEQDVMYASGMQQANLGPAQPDVTATVGTIAEQSRMSVSASNVDDLDDCLAAAAFYGGQIMLQEFSPETWYTTVGDGAKFPTMDRSSYINEVFLQVEAASSGRPNKAIEVANWERLAPILLQFGANPQAVIRETILRADERLEPEDFFPIAPMAMQEQGAVDPNGASPQQPLQPSPSGVAMPLAGA